MMNKRPHDGAGGLPTITVIADDLTGACDTGAVFARLSTVPVTVWPRGPAVARVRVVDTETRRMTAAGASARVIRAAMTAPADLTFKKIDSGLRGPVGAEVAAAMTATGRPAALVCPAFPARGRIVVDGTLLVDGVPVKRASLGRDGTVGSGAQESSVVELLRPGIEGPLARLPLAEVRGSESGLAARLTALPGAVVVADAETDSDLDALVNAALATRPAPLLAGSAGLAGALAARLDLLPEPVTLPRGRWLLVAGSRHPATRAQCRAAAETGMTVLASPEELREDPETVATRLAMAAVELLDTEPWDLVAVTGGETAIALYRALRAERIDVLGPPCPGLAFGFLRIPGRPAVPVITKAGGFGDPHLWISLAREALV